MRTLNFAKRNFKEIIRDPLSIIFSVLLPLFLLFIFNYIDLEVVVGGVNLFKTSKFPDFMPLWAMKSFKKRL